MIRQYFVTLEVRNRLVNLINELKRNSFWTVEMLKVTDSANNLA